MPEGELMGSEEQPRESTLHTLRCGLPSVPAWPALSYLLCPQISTRLDMPARPLELDCVPASLSMEGDDAAIGAVELCPRLHPMDANALPCSERLPGCG